MFRSGWKPKVFQEVLADQKWRDWCHWKQKVQWVKLWKCESQKNWPPRTYTFNRKWSWCGWEPWSGRRWSRRQEAGAGGDQMALISGWDWRRVQSRANGHTTMTWAVENDLMVWVDGDSPPRWILFCRCLVQCIRLKVTQGHVAWVILHVQTICSNV